MNKEHVKWWTTIQKYGMDKIINEYPSNLILFLKTLDKKNVEKEINYLQNKQNINNYAKHYDGYSQLIKIVNGWLLEDLLCSILGEFNCSLNGSDIERHFYTRPTNEADLLFVINRKKYYVEIVNINMIYGKHFREWVNKGKFINLKWWQGRKRKYYNLKELYGEYFLINVTDNFEHIMIKKCLNSDSVINPKYRKWGSYIQSAVFLGESYHIVNCKNKKIHEIEEEIIKTIKKLA